MPPIDPTERTRPSLRVPLLVSLLSLLVTGALVAYLAHSIAMKDHATFRNEASTTIDGVVSRVGTAVTLLRGTAGLFNASEQVEAAEFAAYVDQLDLRSRYPGILGIGFSRQLQADAFEEAANALRRYDEALQLWPQHPRDEFHGIAYLQPLDARNRAALGYDMFTEPTRRRAMAAARDSGQLAATGKVLLVQEITRRKQAGFLLYHPLYEGLGEPLTVDERRRRLTGFAFSAMRIGDLLQGVRGTGPELIDLQIFDGGVPIDEALMYSTTGTRGDLPPRFTADELIEVAGRPWLLRVTTRPSFYAVSQAWLVPWIALLGLVTSLVLGAISWLQVRERAAAERSAISQRRISDELHREREWLSATLTSIAEGVVVVDRDQCIVSMNPVAERLTGWQQDEARGQPLSDIVISHPDDRGSLSPVDGALGGSATAANSGRALLVARDGHELPVEHSSAPIVDPAGIAGGAVIVLRDITERQRHEHALQQSEERERARSERLQQLAAVSPLLNSARSTPALVASIEREAARLLDAPSAALRLADDEQPDSAEGLSVPLRLQEDERLGWLVLAPRADAPYGSDDRLLLQQLAGIAAIALRNVSLYEELRANDRRKDEFLATLAHELRNPLAPISSSLEVLRLFPTGEHAERAREVAERQTRHMVRLIDDLLDLSRISRGVIVLRREPLVLAEAVEAAIETAEPLIRARGHRLAITPLDHGVLVDGDATRLAQVFANLLNNAANYTGPGGNISIRMAAVGDRVEVSIRDSGIGIAPEQLASVFDMFVQADRSVGAAGGLGIGLTLVRRLVEMHGGTVEARSAGIGHGAEFTVRLPLASAQGLARPAVPDAGRADAGEGSRGAAHGADRAPPAAFAGRLLVVDDNRDAAESLAMMLRLDGHDVDVVHDGHAALQQAERARPDLALLDIGLPGLDGYQLARRLRATYGDRIGLVAITGWGQEGDRRRAQEAGFDRHLVKPVDYPALQSVIHELLLR